jgi:hypothetical protein
VTTADYVLDVPSAPRGPSGDESISVLPFGAGPKASGQMLLYRVEESRFEHDFYNRLLAPPAQMLSGALRRYLSQSRIGQIREPGAPLASDFVVQPRLTELYADYRDEAHPKAVVSMVMVLIRRGDDGSREVFERTYRRSVPLPMISPQHAVDGWSRGIGQIFGEFTADVRRSAG